MTYDIGQLLGASWKSYVQNIKTYLLVSVVLAFISSIPVLFRPSIGTSDVPLLYLIAVVVSIIVGILIWLSLFSFVYFAETDQNKAFMQSVSHTLSRFFPLVFTAILLGVFLFGLFILLIIPAIIFGYYWIFVFHAVLFRKKSFMGALSYSKSLVNDNWWRTFGYFLLVSLLVSTIAGVVTWPLGFVSVIGAALGLNALILAAISFVSVFVSSFVGIFALVFQTGYFLALEDEKKVSE